MNASPKSTAGCESKSSFASPHLDVSGEKFGPVTDAGHARRDIPSIWSELQVQDVMVSHVVSSTQAGDNVALVFEDLRIELNTDQSPVAATSVATIRIPVTPDADKEFLGYLVSVEGWITKSKGTRGVLLADVAGAAKTLEFPYGEQKGMSPGTQVGEGDGSDTQAVDVSEENGGYTQQIFSVERRASKNRYSDGQRPAVPPCTITLVLAAPRLSAQETILLTVESMSIEAIEL